jgi:hypothetical protein
MPGLMDHRILLGRRRIARLAQASKERLGLIDEAMLTGAPRNVPDGPRSFSPKARPFPSARGKVRRDGVVEWSG